MTLAPRVIGVLLLSILMMVCASQYKTVQQTQVTTVRTDRGEEIRIEKQPFIAFQEVIERSPNVKSVTRMTNLKGEREPGFLSLSPSGADLAFQALEDIEGVNLMNLWRIPTTGGAGMTRLTTGRYYDLEPSYSPDGSSTITTTNDITNH